MTVQTQAEYKILPGEKLSIHAFHSANQKTKEKNGGEPNNKQQHIHTPTSVSAN